MYLTTLAACLFQMFLMIVLGYVLRRKAILSDKGLSELSRLLVTVIMPCSMLNSGSQSFSPDLGHSLLIAAIIVLAYYVASFLLSTIVFKLFEKDKARFGVSVTMTVFANIGFLGMPLASELYGAEGLLVAVVYNLFYNFFISVVGQRYFSGGAHVSIKARLLDPLCLSSILALMLFVSPFTLPEVLNGTLSRIGSMTAPVSMFIIGGQLIGTDWKAVFTRRDSYLVCLMRNVLLPLAALLLLRPRLTDPVLFGTLVLLTALPIGSLNSILAEKYGADVKFVNETMVLSIVLSAVTVPLMMVLVLS